MLKKFIFLSLFLLIPLVAKESRSTSLNTLYQTTLKLKGKSFQIWLALDAKQKKKGLSALKDSEVSSTQGMLFLYPYEEKLSFWMKNTYFDIDIAYIKSDGEVVDMTTMEKMRKEPFCSSKKVRYALELKAGSFKLIGLKVGDFIDLPKEIKAFL